MYSHTNNRFDVMKFLILLTRSNLYISILCIFIFHFQFYFCLPLSLPSISYSLSVYLFLSLLLFLSLSLSHTLFLVFSHTYSCTSEGRRWTPQSIRLSLTAKTANNTDFHLPNSHKGKDSALIKYLVLKPSSHLSTWILEKASIWTNLKNKNS